MLRKIRIFESDCTDPYVNLATEKQLMETVPNGCCILYLWQNQNTVVIGRNQNPWAECRLTLLEQEGGTLARRLSGGGAVYHDLGNLNFTFLMNREDHDLQKQIAVIRTACQALGIPTEASGRNDLLADGRKFSGNAFYQSKTHAYHHGTLLVNVDMDKLSRYLNPPKAKLEAKGVSSVRSRVVNLSELAPGLTCARMCQCMREAFTAVYGMTPEPLQLTDADREAIRLGTAENSSWQWLYGAPLPFSFLCENRFPWGYIQLQLQVKSGTVLQAKVYTDAMDWTLAPRLETALTGCRFGLAAMQEALRSFPELADPVREDLCQLLAAQEL